MKKAFTLIELLVVVLIIGILAAIALPKYARAVERSKAVQVKTILTTLYKNYQLCTTEFGAGASECNNNNLWERLSIELPGRLETKQEDQEEADCPTIAANGGGCLYFKNWIYGFSGSDFQALADGGSAESYAQGITTYFQFDPSDGTIICKTLDDNNPYCKMLCGGDNCKI